jgi:serine/threonine protein kinase
MGEVYRATDTKLGRDVALKVLPPEMASSPERLERFRREAKALAALDHPGIVTVYSVEEADGVHFLTMQLVKGEPLDRLIPEGGLPIQRILDIATPLAEALAAAHDKGVVHRDLKPANVMVGQGGRVKVLDFGLAKLAAVQSEESIDSPPSTEVRTREGVVMGTVPYMSPEQVQGRPVDHRTDIFSLGVVLYEMATGQRPFAGDNAATVMSAILRDEPRAATGIRAGLPEPLARTIDRCLKKNPSERPPSARDVAAEIRAIDQERVASATAAGPEERGRGPRRVRFIAAVVALVAGGVWWWTRGAGSRWARSVALPAIARLVEKEDYYGAFLLARQAQPHLPGDRPPRPRHMGAGGVS